MPTIVTRRIRKGPALAAKTVRDLADRMLVALRLEDAELSILLVDDRQIQELNRLHRDKDKPTDVLSFPLDEEPTEGVPRLLGDVVISLPTALRQARSRKRTLFPEVRFLLAHGVLHLLGFDHGTPKEKRDMDARTRKLVRAVSPRTQVRAKRRP
jgi:probable rRNA maturation factor